MTWPFNQSVDVMLPCFGVTLLISKTSGMLGLISLDSSLNFPWNITAFHFLIPLTIMLANQIVPWIFAWDLSGLFKTFRLTLVLKYELCSLSILLFKGLISKGLTQVGLKKSNYSFASYKTHWLRQFNAENTLQGQLSNFIIISVWKKIKSPLRVHSHWVL